MGGCNGLVLWVREQPSLFLVRYTAWGGTETSEAWVSVRGGTIALVISALVLVIILLFLLLLRAVSGPAEDKVVTREVTREVTRQVTVEPKSRTQPSPRT